MTETQAAKFLSSFPFLNVCFDLWNKMIKEGGEGEAPFKGQCLEEQWNDDINKLQS